MSFKKINTRISKLIEALEEEISLLEDQELMDSEELECLEQMHATARNWKVELGLLEEKILDGRQ